MKTIIKSAKLLLLFLALGMFISADYAPGEDAAVIKEEIQTKGELPVMISCFGCTAGNGMMIAHNPNDSNLAYYADEKYEIRWYNTSGKLYAVNTTHIWYVCGESFTVEIKTKKTSDRGVAGFAAIPCRPVHIYPVNVEHTTME